MPELRICLPSNKYVLVDVRVGRQLRIQSSLQNFAFIWQ